MIYNKIRLCNPPDSRQLFRDNLKNVVIHRIDLRSIGIHDDMLSAEVIAQQFKTHPELLKTCGGILPYHIVVQPNGSIEQMVSLSQTTAGARGINRCSIHVALVGDFRIAPEAKCSGERVAVEVKPTENQIEALTWLLELLMPVGFGEMLRVGGHTDLSPNPYKVCPGSLVPLDMIVQGVAEKLKGQMEQWSVAYCDFVRWNSGLIG